MCSVDMLERFNHLFRKKSYIAKIHKNCISDLSDLRDRTILVIVKNPIERVTFYVSIPVILGIFLEKLFTAIDNFGSAEQLIDRKKLFVKLFLTK